MRTWLAFANAKRSCVACSRSLWCAEMILLEASNSHKWVLGVLEFSFLHVWRLGCWPLAHLARQRKAGDCDSSLCRHVSWPIWERVSYYSYLFIFSSFRVGVLLAYLGRFYSSFLICFGRCSDNRLLRILMILDATKDDAQRQMLTKDMLVVSPW